MRFSYTTKTTIGDAFKVTEWLGVSILDLSMTAIHLNWWNKKEITIHSEAIVHMRIKAA